ncbi:putative ORFan [Tupanvirus deep ocean]|uniref:ORFan n=2 Tax=Tupanvirus TaxID=2094720 RepID=A0AC62A8U8_9VIRU|nr:putative ORFan [Tupanvirus deep ocean]QKU34201.1 putative ORFan [Tupanvirus deep ocean]
MYTICKCSNNIIKMNTKKYYCDECYACHNNEKDLIEMPACADSDVGYGGCCYKSICVDDCQFKCIICGHTYTDAKKMHKIRDSVLDFISKEHYGQDYELLSENRDKIFICDGCTKSGVSFYDTDQLERVELWWGISNDEWLNRYG